MIPKVVHYVWLSGEELPLLNRRCLESWQRVLPDYELRRWSSADVDLESIPYVREAVMQKKWAFATDYLRMDILCRDGGIYLDSDVFLYGDFDAYLNNRFFSCIEHHGDSANAVLQAACMGAEPEHPFTRACAEYYRERHFIRPDGSLDTEELAPDIYARIAGRFGFRSDRMEEQALESGMHIYGPDMVASSPWDIPRGCMAVHTCAGSWREMDPFERRLYSVLKLNMMKQDR